jgi:hypothetical protein
MSAAAAPGGPHSAADAASRAKAASHGAASPANGIGAARSGAASAAAAAPADLGATWCRRAARAVKQRLLDTQQLFREYQYVVALDDTIRHAQGDAMRADSAARNRYANVLPYDYNR